MFALLLLTAVAASALPAAPDTLERTNFKNGPDLVPHYGALAKSVFRRPDASTGERVAKYDPLTDEVNPEELGSYAAGDILVPGQTGRNGLVAASARWPRGRIPFVIGAKFEPKDLDTIYRAMSVYHETTCVRFVPWNGRDQDYVSIESSSTGCWASVGRTGGRQVVNLQSPACLAKTGTVLHELMHTVGFLHEQNRYERDNHVDILWQNVDKGREENFKKVPASTALTDVPYDYESVMHYSTMAFSSNGEPTIRTKVKGVRVGQRERLSLGDLTKIRMMYRCDGPYSYAQ